MNRAGPKMPPALPERIADRGGDDLEHGKQHDDFQNNVAVQNLLDVVVADAHHFGHEIAHDPDRQAAGDRLKPDRRISASA